jgi:protein-S-isoprenylcysteine O-methyltransferase Ste14
MDMDKRLIARYFIRETMGVVILGVALMWPAGRIDWWPAWALVAVMALWVAATAFVILRYNPDLLAERLGPRQGGKSWDTAIMSAIGLLGLARLLLAGFDQRYGWTGGFPIVAQIAALVLAALGYALGVWATASNAFFSQIVRVQSEREHAVATGGPYRFVRHPAYIGTIAFELGVPVLLASWWALIPGLINAVLFVVRTALEDRTLQADLEGYADYARQVRYRLLPGIW